jgi:AcrR family transcriptional regulator
MDHVRTVAMPTADDTPSGVRSPRRSDATRNERTLLDAAAAVFVTGGVDAPVRQIAAKAGVGMGTVYRHFPTRADLVVAVYRHQIQACVDAGPALLAAAASPFAALRAWVDLFVEFLVTKHGLAGALRHDPAGADTLHGLFLDRLLPVLTDLLAAAAAAGETTAGIDAYEVMRGIGNLCAGAEHDPAYDARRVVSLLLNGCRT